MNNVKFCLKMRKFMKVVYKNSKILEVDKMKKLERCSYFKTYWKFIIWNLLEFL